MASVMVERVGHPGTSLFLESPGSHAGILFGSRRALILAILGPVPVMDGHEPWRRNLPEIDPPRFRPLTIFHRTQAFGFHVLAVVAPTHQARVTFGNAITHQTKDALLQYTRSRGSPAKSGFR